MAITHPPLATYRVEFEISINAKPAKVWQALTKDIARWWPAHFLSHASAKKFALETHVGGRLYEDWGRGAGAEWGRVMVYQPPEKLVWAGNVFGTGGHDWGRYFLTITLKEDAGKTLLTLSDAGFGMFSDQMGHNLEAGWRELFSEHFKKYTEGARRASQRKRDVNPGARVSTSR